MCFNQKYSFLFTILGLLSYKISNGKNHSHKIIIFYTIMELLQTIQYIHVNKCNKINSFLTEIAYILVIVQPLMWNYIFLQRQKNTYYKGILYCAVILCGVWIIGNLLRRSKSYSKNNFNNEIMQGTKNCTYRKKDEHLYWNLKFYNNPGFDANWFMYFILWIVPGMIVPGNHLGIFGILVGMIGSYFYLSYKRQTFHIFPSLWCLTSVPTIFLSLLLEN